MKVLCLLSSFSRGSSILEMILFAPLALLFLFVATDAGIVMIERAAFIDALRSGINSQQILNSKRAVLELENDFSLMQNEQQVSRLLKSIADEIVDSILRAKNPNHENVGDIEKSIRVVVTLIDVSIDPESGALTSFQIFSPEEVRGAFEIQASIPSFPYISKNQFIEKKIAEAGKIIPFYFAIPLSPVYQAIAPEVLIPKYQEHTLLIYAEGTTLSRGIAQRMVKTLLGKFYAVQEQQLVIMRSHLD